MPEQQPEIVQKDKTPITWYDILTVPNAMTLFRMLASPWAYQAVAESPAENWLKVGVVSLTDLEGNAARLEDLPIIGGFLALLGFRRSEIGREGDPVADAIYGTAVAAGSIKSRSIPGWIAKLSIAQKAVKSVITVAATAQGTKLEVHNIGKAGEVATMVGFYACIGAEAIEDPALKSAAKIIGSGVALAGVGVASLATVGLAIDAGYVNAPKVQAVINLCDTALESITPGT